MIKDKITKDDILQELIKNQRKDVPIEFKLSLQDLKRISNNLDKSIFTGDICCIWKGYVTNKNNNNRAKYINFYFNHKKMALHRLLYINFVDNLEKSQYIKYSCTNKGQCCNLNHIKKVNNKKQKKKEKPPVIEKKDVESNIVSFD